MRKRKAFRLADSQGRPLVSVIIRTFNEAKHLGHLLELCYGQKTDFPFEVIIVDSGSDDDTLTIARRHPVVIQNIAKSEFTFGRSLNLGLARAQGDYAIIVSAHCYPMGTDWLAKMILPFSNPQIGMVYGKQRGDARNKYSEHQIFMKWFPEETVEQTDFAFCNNANSAIRCSLWKEIPFDESLTGLEDLDWAKKIIARGFHLSYRADAGVYHIHEESYPQVYRRYYREALAYKAIYPKQKFSFFHFALFLVLNLVSDLAHAVREAVFWREAGSIFKFRFQQFLATYQAHQQKDPLNQEMQRRLYYPRSPRELMKPRSSGREAERNGL